MMSGQHHKNVVPNLQPGVRFYFSNVTTNGYVPFHWHSSLEIITVVKGHLRFTLNGQVYHVRDNQFFIIPSGVVHDVANDPNQAYVLQIPIQFITPYYAHPENVTFTNRHQASPTYQQVVTQIYELGRLIQHPDATTPFDFGITLLTILKLLFQEFRTEQPLPIVVSNIRNIIIYINEHHRQRLTVQGLATRFNYNSNYLSRLFKQQVGLSLIEYIYEVKLSHLYDDLLHSDERIADLMAQNGLTNRRTSREIFKRMYGKLPKDVRTRPTKPL